MAIRTSWVAIVLAVGGLGGAACSRAAATPSLEPVASPGRTDAGQLSAKRPATADGGTVEADKGALPIAEVGDCPAICGKLLHCGEGPFDSLSDCSDACEDSIDDRKSAKTYRCVAKAKDCAHVKTCAR